MEKILITSALPYANGPLHFGHIAGAYLPGDCYARFKRLQGNDVLYICGSDEHGVAITLSAEMAGKTPQQHVDHFHQILKDFFAQLEFSFDHYSRTTWAGHVETTTQYFQDLLSNGFIEERVTQQLYSEKDKKFLADRYVVGTCPKCGYAEARGDECQKCGASYEATDLIQPRSKLTHSPLILKPTKHWFLLFDRFKDQLTDWITKKEWKPNVVKFAQNYIDDLRARAITRDSDWGIPVPLSGAEGKVFYVWFDAPIGYISATKEWAQKKGAPDAWKDYWCDPKTKLVQFIGKDNIPFHALFFPAMTMGQKQPYKLVDELPANEFYNLEGKQFSKSEGWYIDLTTFFQKFTPDQIRYAIAANAPENQDSEFTWKDFQRRCNSELLGKYGNLINRTLVFTATHLEGKIPPLHAPDAEFTAHIQALMQQIAEAYDTFHLRKASQLIMELAHAGNAYFDAKKPWKAEPEEQQTIIANTLKCIQLLALASSPIIPATAEKVWRLIGYKQPLTTKTWREIVGEPLHAGTTLPAPQILFQKVEDEVINMEIAKLEAPKVEAPKTPTVTIDEVRKMEMRVGQILTVERVPKSKKLLKFSIDIGTETRQVVSGIGEKMEDLNFLIGRKVIVITNLPTATIMGVESQGMLLVASNAEGLELPDFKLANPGDVVS